MSLMQHLKKTPIELCFRIVSGAQPEIFQGRGGLWS